jgi:hypothetical protein
MLGFVEDEWTFSVFAFMKDKLCNRLGLNLDTIVHMIAQEFYIRDNFLYQEAITTWKDQKVWIEAITLTCFVSFTTQDSNVLVSMIWKSLVIVFGFVIRL